MKKIDMVTEMLENGYLDPFEYAMMGKHHNLVKFIQGKKTIEQIFAEAVNRLQYHTDLGKVKEMYKNYVTYFKKGA